MTNALLNSNLNLNNPINPQLINQPLHIVTWNIRGLGNKRKFLEVNKWAKSNNVDALCLQEIHLNEKKYKQVISALPCASAISYGDSNSKGVMTILYNNNWNVIEAKNDTDGRILGTIISNSLNKLAIINYYAPNIPNQQITSIEKLKVWLDWACAYDIILLGDFNVCLNNEDKSDNKPHNRKYANLLKDLLNEYNLIDVWTTVNGKKEGYTWK